MEFIREGKVHLSGILNFYDTCILCWVYNCKYAHELKMCKDINVEYDATWSSHKAWKGDLIAKRSMFLLLPSTDKCVLVVLKSLVGSWSYLFWKDWDWGWS